MQQATLDRNDSALGEVLYMALELGDKKWKLGFSDGGKRREVTIAGGDRARLLEEVARAKAKLRISPEALVVSCYEAGREGFWLHRWLVSEGIDNRVVDSASMERSARGRRRKTDRLDVHKLLRHLMAYHREGDRERIREVRVPSDAQEDARRWHRCWERLTKERNGHRSRIETLLIGQGIRFRVGRDFLARLEAARRWDGTPVPGDLREELRWEWERLQVVERQRRVLEAEQRERLREGETPAYRQVMQLMRLCGIGRRSAWLFVMEFFAWRRFRNGREVGALAGLTGTPFSSGQSEREQGISKAGNRRVRAMAVEIAWGWTRFQPECALVQWYQSRYGGGTRRQRRVGIVALARRLLVALWRYLEFGEVPAGARLKPAVVR